MIIGDDGYEASERMAAHHRLNADGRSAQKAAMQLEEGSDAAPDLARRGMCLRRGSMS